MDEACSKIFSQFTVGCCKICQKCTNVHVFLFFFLHVGCADFSAEWKHSAALFLLLKSRKTWAFLAHFHRATPHWAVSFLPRVSICSCFCSVMATITLNGVLLFLLHEKTLCFKDICISGCTQCQWYRKNYSHSIHHCMNTYHHWQQRANWVKFVFLTEQLLYSLYNWVSIRHISHSLKIAYIIVWTCSWFHYLKRKATLVSQLSEGQCWILVSPPLWFTLKNIRNY